MAADAQGGMSTCQFPDLAAGDSAIAQVLATKLNRPECTAFCKDCVYRLPHRQCPIVNVTACIYGTAELPEPKEAFPICTTKIPNKGPSCVTNCDEFKYTSYWKPK
jgi:hypothetical protein